MSLIDDYLKDIEKEISQQKKSVKTIEYGFVDEVKDGVVILEGLDNIAYGELFSLITKL